MSLAAHIRQSPYQQHYAEHQADPFLPLLVGLIQKAMPNSTTVATPITQALVAAAVIAEKPISQGDRNNTIPRTRLNELAEATLAPDKAREF